MTVSQQYVSSVRESIKAHTCIGTTLQIRQALQKEFEGRSDVNNIIYENKKETSTEDF